MQTIEWNGKITIKDSSITEKQYQKYFDSNAITYNLVQSTLAVCHDSNLELTADYFNFNGRSELINSLSYGKAWRRNSCYDDMPHCRIQLDCFMDGQKIKFYSLPFEIRNYIIKSIINESEFIGKVNVKLCASLSQKEAFAA